MLGVLWYGGQVAAVALYATQDGRAQPKTNLHASASCLFLQNLDVPFLQQVLASLVFLRKSLDEVQCIMARLPNGMWIVLALPLVKTSAA